MGAAFAFILSPIGKFAIFVALLASIGVACYVAIQEHDANVLSRENLATQQAISAANAAQAARTIAVLEKENAQTAADVAASTSVKRNIANAKSTSSCAGSAAVGAALLGLQPTGGSHGTQNKAAGRTVVLPTGAGATRIGD